MGVIIGGGVGISALASGPLAIEGGGTGQITAPLAFNALAPIQTGQDGKFLTTNGGVASWAILPTSGTVPISGGGTGQITAPLAFNALAPVQTGNAGRVLTTDGTSVSWQPSSSVFNGGTIANATTYNASVYEKKNINVVAAATTVNASLGNVVALALNLNITSMVINNVVPAGNACALTFFLTQDATGGRTVIWPTGTRWESNGTPVLTVTGGKTDIFQLITHDGGVTWFGTVFGLNF